MKLNSADTKEADLTHYSGHTSDDTPQPLSIKHCILLPKSLGISVSEKIYSACALILWLPRP